MINILYITSYNLRRGGVERCIETWLKYFPNPDDLRITWYCPGEILNTEYAEEFQQLNIQIVYGNIPGEQKYKARKFYDDIRAILKSQHFDIVHVNTGIPLATYFALQCAKNEGVPVRIAHSHSYCEFHGIALKTYLACLRFQINRLSTYRLATSKAAGQFMFGKKQFHILYNAINADNFSFSEAQRNSKRSQIGVLGKQAIGYVGTLTPGKNPLFAVEAFAAYHKANPSSVFVMLGDGTLKNSVHEATVKLKIQDSVLMLGERKDVSSIMQALDLLLFPSITEGLGLVAIEAQSTGLPVLASEGVPRETEITDLIEYLPITDPQLWAQKIEKRLQSNKIRESHKAEVLNAGYDVYEVAKELQEIYETQVTSLHRHY